jgi:hypothetical protein
MVAINRKQVSLCAEHHKRLHDGSFNAAKRLAWTEGLKNLKK